MMKKVLLTVLSLFAVMVMASGQETMTLTLDQAIGIALDENPTIKIANLEIERQDYVRRETRSNLYPNLSATGSYTRSIVQQQMSRSGLSFGADNTITGTASISMPLFAPAVYASLQMNRTQMEAAVESARSTKISLVNEVTKAYYGILLAEESLSVLLGSEELMRQTVDNTQTMFDSELASEYDLLTATVQLGNLQPNIISTRNAIEVSKMYFRMLVGLPQSLEFAVQGSLPEFSGEILGGKGYFTTDVSGNSELRALDIQADLLADQLRLINAQRMPTLAAYGSATITGNDMPDISFTDMMGGGTGGNMFSDLTPEKYPTLYPALAPYLPELGQFMGSMLGGGQTTAPATGFWWQHPIQAGLQLSIPIFSGGKINSQARGAKTAMKQIALQRDYLEQAKIMEARTSINNIFTAREKMMACVHTEEQARKAYGISAARYKAGMGTILELNSAEISLTQAKLNYSQATYDYLSAQADYEKVIGREYDYENNIK